MPGRDPWKILTGGIEYPPLCVRIQGFLPQSRVFCISEIWSSFDILLLFCYFLPTPCSLGCHMMFLGASPVLIWCPPIYLVDIGICLSATGSLLRSWPQSSVSWRLVILFPLGGCDHFCVCVCGVFCRIWCCPSVRCVFVSLPLWGSPSTCMIACQRRRRLIWVDQCPCSNGSAVYCICASRARTVFIPGVWWGGTVICHPLVASVILGIFDLLRLGLGRSEDPFRIMQIHPTWRNWMCCGGVWLYLLLQTGFYALIPWTMTPVLS